MTKPIIKLKNISFFYPGSGTAVLDGLDLELFSGDRIGMMAPNGSGKTTLFHVIMGLCKPSAGTIEIFGSPAASDKDFSRVRSKIGLLFQEADDQLFCPRVLDDVTFGPLNLGCTRREAISVARKTLARLGLEDFEESITHRLSGGQKRLVALASVLAMNPEVLLLDEPTAGLDTGVKENLVSILNSLDISYIVISHEFNFLTAITTKLYSMEHGKVLTGDDIHVHQHEHMHKLGKHPHRHV